MSPNDKQIYISYAWGGESERIVNELDADLQSKGITIIRDKRNLGYKGMIRDFMQQIGRGYAVIVVISDKYLKSPNCMYELVEIAESKQFHDRIFPVVLADADIYRAATQLQYIKHWEDEIKALKEGLKVLDPTNLQGIYQKLNLYDRIRDNISNLIDILSDMNTLTPDMHENNNFATLIEMLKERLGEDTSVEEVKEPIVEEPVPPPVARRTSTTPKASETKKTKTAKPTARPAKAAKADSGNAYMNQVVRKLLRDDYQELPEEQFGDLRFSRALEKSTKYLFGTLSEYHRVVILEGGELDEDRFLELEKDIKQYSKELGDKRSSYAHVICLVLAGSVSESLRELIQDTKPGKYAFAEMGSSVMVVYSAEENEIVYPKVIGENYDSKYSEKIPQYLRP